MANSSNRSGGRGGGERVGLVRHPAGRWKVVKFNERTKIDFFMEEFDLQDCDSLPAWEHCSQSWRAQKRALSGSFIHTFNHCHHHFPLSKVLRKINFHVVAFDYRGYADSSKHIAPTETGVVRDARAVYDWLCSRAGGKVGAFWISSTLPKQLE